jgi:hypothetical protein
MFLPFAGKGFETETQPATVARVADRNPAAADQNLATAAWNPAAAAWNRAASAWIRPSPLSRAASAVARCQQGNFDPVLLSPDLLPILLPSCVAAACFSKLLALLERSRKVLASRRVLAQLGSVPPRCPSPTTSFRSFFSLH